MFKQATPAHEAADRMSKYKTLMVFSKNIPVLISPSGKDQATGVDTSNTNRPRMEMIYTATVSTSSPSLLDIMIPALVSSDGQESQRGSISISLQQSRAIESTQNFANKGINFTASIHFSNQPYTTGQSQETFYVSTPAVETATPVHKSDSESFVEKYRNSVTSNSFINEANAIFTRTVLSIMQNDSLSPDIFPQPTTQHLQAQTLDSSQPQSLLVTNYATQMILDEISSRLEQFSELTLNNIYTETHPVLPQPESLLAHDIYTQTQSGVVLTNMFTRTNANILLLASGQTDVHLQTHPTLSASDTDLSTIAPQMYTASSPADSGLINIQLQTDKVSFSPLSGFSNIYTPLDTGLSKSGSTLTGVSIQTETGFFIPTDINTQSGIDSSQSDPIPTIIYSETALPLSFSTLTNSYTKRDTEEPTSGTLLTNIYTEAEPRLSVSVIITSAASEGVKTSFSEIFSSEHHSRDVANRLLPSELSPASFSTPTDEIYQTLTDDLLLFDSYSNFPTQRQISTYSKQGQTWPVGSSVIGTATDSPRTLATYFRSLDHQNHLTLLESISRETILSPESSESGNSQPLGETKTMPTYVETSGNMLEISKSEAFTKHNFHPYMTYPQYGEYSLNKIDSLYTSSTSETLPVDTELDIETLCFFCDENFEKETALFSESINERNGPSTLKPNTLLLESSTSIGSSETQVSGISQHFLTELDPSFRNWRSDPGEGVSSYASLTPVLQYTPDSATFMEITASLQDLGDQTPIEQSIFSFKDTKISTQVRFTPSSSDNQEIVKTDVAISVSFHFLSSSMGFTEFPQLSATTLDFSNTESNVPDRYSSAKFDSTATVRDSFSSSKPAIHLSSMVGNSANIIESFNSSDSNSQSSLIDSYRTTIRGSSTFSDTDTRSSNTAKYSVTITQYSTAIETDQQSSVSEIYNPTRRESTNSLDTDIQPSTDASYGVTNMQALTLRDTDIQIKITERKYLTPISSTGYGELYPRITHSFSSSVIRPEFSSSPPFPVHILTTDMNNHQNQQTFSMMSNLDDYKTFYPFSNFIISSAAYQDTMPYFSSDYSLTTALSEYYMTSAMSFTTLPSSFRDIVTSASGDHYIASASVDFLITASINNFMLSASGGANISVSSGLIISSASGNISDISCGRS